MFQGAYPFLNIPLILHYSRAKQYALYWPTPVINTLALTALSGHSGESHTIAELVKSAASDGLREAEAEGLTLALGLTEADGLSDTELDELGLVEAEGLPDAEGEIDKLADGEIEAEGLMLKLALGLSEAEGEREALDEAEGLTD